MSKRLILALALSFLVLFAWSAIFTKPQHTGIQHVATQPSFLSTSSGKRTADISPNPAKTNPQPTTFSYKVGQEELIFLEDKAGIKDAIFNNYQTYIFPLQYGLVIQDEFPAFKVKKQEPGIIRFVQSGKTKEIIKDFIFSNGGKYDFWLVVKVKNISSEAISLQLPIIAGVLDFSSNNLNTRYQGIVIGTNEKTMHLNGRKDIVYDGINFAALRDRYFCLVVDPESKDASASIMRIDNKAAELTVSSGKIMLAPGQETEHKYHIYLGPQDLSILNSVNPVWSSLIHYGFFDFISQILLQLLAFFYSIVHNWGWAIIILSVAIYLILFPLTLKQMRSMKEMQALQPHIEELKKLHKDNPQKLNKEIMELYREHKVNPFGGCLPLLLQMPIFFGLYQALMRSVALKGAKFLWIKDLSEPDRLFILSKSFPIIGNEVNLLPVIMAIVMFFQQRMSTVSAATSSKEQQRMMLIIFPVMFGIIFYHMPAGLVLYWFINSTLMTIYQWRIRHAK